MEKREDKRELKIVRLNSKNFQLEERVYEALRKSKFGEDEWNPHGRHYKIKGLYDLSRTRGLILLFSNGIGNDVETYRIQREERSRLYREEGLEAAV